MAEIRGMYSMPVQKMKGSDDFEEVTVMGNNIEMNLRKLKARCCKLDGPGSWQE